MADRKQSRNRQRGNGQGTLYKRKERVVWYMSWYDHIDKRHTASSGTTDKAAAQRILAKRVEGVALRRGGVIDARKDRFSVEGRKPLTEHIADYIGHCRHVGQAPRHVDQKQTHLDRLIKLVEASRLNDLTADGIERYMRAQLDNGLSARTANFARQIAVAFASWCVKTGRLESNPLNVVPKLDEQRDRRRVRRPLSDDELARLLDVAEDRGRKAWYLTAVLAGLRKGDLQRLRWCDISFDEQTITISHGKAKRTDVIPMHTQLADELSRRRDDSMATPRAKVFPQTVTDLTRLKDFLRAELAREVVVMGDDGKPVMVGKGKRKRPRTRIVAEDAEGRVIDLHAMRTTLGTNLARAGVAPQIAQRIMRHSDYKTTLKHYTVLGLTDTAKAIGELTSIGRPAGESAKATGTDDPTPIGSLQQYGQQRERETVRTGANRRSQPGDDHAQTHGRKSSNNTASCESMRPDATICNTPRGCNSMVECQPSKLNVEGSSPFTRFCKALSTNRLQRALLLICGPSRFTLVRWCS